MMHEEINVSIVCPNSLVKEGLRRILSEDTFSVRHSLGNAASLLNDESEGAFLDDGELVLFESSGPDIDQDIRALHEKHPNCKLVLLADSFDFDGMIDAFRAGADGYIIKDIECQSLIESLKLIALLDSLSDRELETLRCLIMGYPNKVIAYRLDISEATVKVHVKAILRKLGVQNRTQAAIWAVNNGLDANAACATLAAKSPNDNAEEGDIEAISAEA